MTRKIQQIFLLTLAAVLALGTASLAAQQSSGAQQPAPSLKSGNSGQAQGQSNGQAQQNGQAAQPATPQPTPEEASAYTAIQNELDPDQQIQLVEDFAKKYPNSILLSDAYFFGASAMQQKNQITKAVEYGEKSLKLRPDNLRSLILLTGLLPQPADLLGSDAEKDAKLKETETDAATAQALLAKLPKPASQTDEQFQKLKTNIISQIHSSLGMVHLQRAMESLTGVDAGELAKAEAEYKMAVSMGDPRPEDYFRLGEVYKQENKIDDSIDAFSKAAQYGQGTVIPQLAQKNIDALKAVKAKQAAAPPPPPKQ